MGMAGQLSVESNLKNSGMAYCLLFSRGAQLEINLPLRKPGAEIKRPHPAQRRRPTESVVLSASNFMQTFCGKLQI